MAKKVVSARCTTGTRSGIFAVTWLKLWQTLHPYPLSTKTVSLNAQCTKIRYTQPPATFFRTAFFSIFCMDERPFMNFSFEDCRRSEDPSIDVFGEDVAVPGEVEPLLDGRSTSCRSICSFSNAYTWVHDITTQVQT